MKHTISDLRGREYGALEYDDQTFFVEYSPGIDRGGAQLWQATFADFPSLESFLSDFFGHIVRPAKLKALRPGTIISGTMRPEDLIPAFMGALETVNPAKADQFRREFDEVFRALDNREEFTFEITEQAELLLGEYLFDALDAHCPEGHSFGAHFGDGADFGVWQYDEHEC